MVWTFPEKYPFDQNPVKNFSVFSWSLDLMQSLDKMECDFDLWRILLFVWVVWISVN